MPNESFLEGTLILSEGDLRTAIAEYVQASFSDPFEIVSVKPIYTGENAGSFEVEWSEI